jgi:hypothetical protein
MFSDDLDSKPSTSIWIALRDFTPGELPNEHPNIARECVLLGIVNEKSFLITSSRNNGCPFTIVEPLEIPVLLRFELFPNSRNHTVYHDTQRLRYIRRSNRISWMKAFDSREFIILIYCSCPVPLIAIQDGSKSH